MLILSILMLISMYSSCYVLFNYSNMSNFQNIIILLVLFFYLLVICQQDNVIKATFNFVLTILVNVTIFNFLNISNRYIQFAILFIVLFIVLCINADVEDSKNASSDNKDSTDSEDTNLNQQMRKDLICEIRKINNYLSISKQEELESSKNKLFEVIKEISNEHSIINITEIGKIIDSINYQNFNRKILKINEILKSELPEVILKKVTPLIALEFEQDINELILERQNIIDELKTNKLRIDIKKQMEEYDIDKIKNYDYKLISYPDFKSPIKQLNVAIKHLDKNVLELFCSEIFIKNQSLESCVETLYIYIDSVLNNTNINDILTENAYVFKDYNYSRNLLIYLSIMLSLKNNEHDYDENEVENLNLFLEDCRNNAGLLREYAKCIII